MDGFFEAGDVPLVQGRAAVAVRLDQAQIPDRAEGVDLDLVVGMVVAVGV